MTAKPEIIFNIWGMFTLTILMIFPMISSIDSNLRNFSLSRDLISVHFYFLQA